MTAPDVDVLRPVAVRPRKPVTQLPPAVRWRYWDGSTWDPLPVEDETDNLGNAGRVRFVTPGTLTKRALFGERLFWIKASVEQGAYPSPPRLQGIFPNTVWAHHGVTLTDEILGSSNGEPNQAFGFARSPVLEGQVIEVGEPTVPSEEERRQIVAAEGDDAIRTMKDDAENVTEVWVRWHGVATLNLSGPGDRHYVVDRIKGRLLFGDGAAGLIPAPGRDNIRAEIYRSGGGRTGNRPAGAVAELKTTAPFVDAVVNHQDASGGSDQETLDAMMARAPHDIKSRDRAITKEDFEWLAGQASREVAKARCLPLTRMRDTGRVPATPGWVTLIVVPDSEENEPMPTSGLIKTVKDYLRDRSLVATADQIDVIGPGYVAVSVQATVVPKRIEESKAVERRLIERLQLFLHPLRGGAGGEGWPFGRDVYLSEVAAVVQSTDGVDRVRAITIQAAGQVGSRITVPDDALPSSGNHAVSVVGA